MIIGIDMGGTTIDAGIVVNGKVDKRISIETNADKDKDFILNNIYNLIDQLFTNDIKGIGIAVPGIVDLETGTVNGLTNIHSWIDVPLKQLLEDKYKVPVIINNDANCFAVGEKHFGKGKGYKNIVALIIGSGFGGGIIINNKLYSGKNCAAGEFDLFPYKENDIEDYVSGKFFERFNTKGEKLFERAKNNDIQAIKIFNEFGFHLGRVMSMVVAAFDPDIIILGASVSKSYEFFKDSMKKSMKEHMWEKVYNNLKIEISTDTNDKAILGAAALYFDSLD